MKTFFRVLPDPTGRTVALLALCLLLSPGTARAQDATCDAAAGRCTGTARLVDGKGQVFATISLQTAPDGSEAVLAVTAPLGIAARPGVRVVTQPGAEAILLPIDVCFPDGCRASTDLAPDALAQMVAAQGLSIQFIPFSSTETVAAEMPAADLIAPLRQAGAALPR